MMIRMTNTTIVQLLIFYFFYSAITPALCLNNETDLLALVAFKDNIIDPRGALDSWKLNETVHYCSWKGISCGSKHVYRVVSIDLDSQGLVGSLSPHIGNLSFLRNIILTNNSFHGEIPEELGRLRRLEYLEFSNNTFDGGIPSNLSQCPNIYYLNLIDNKLTGIIPPELSSLKKLAYLGLSDNNLPGIIPPFLGNLTSLRLLSLSNCGLQGEIPVSLGRLKNLRALMLGLNNLIGTIPIGLFNISTIEIFDMFSNKLQGTLPSDIGNTLPNLIHIGLGENNFIGVIPVSLSNASFLQYIHLSANSFTGPMPKHLDRLSDLEWLSICSTNVKDDISFISSLTNCTRLTDLEILDNLLSGSLPNSIANLTTQLARMSMSINRIHGTIPSGIGNLIGLDTLYLHSNLLSGPIPSSIGKLTRLQELDLGDNRLTNKLPFSLGNLTSLNTLFVASNNISGSIPHSLINSSKLFVLDLSFNNLSGPIPREILSLSSISVYVDLSSNTLSGSIPSEVGSLRNLGALVLSNNRLSGLVPSTISNCISLERLYLDGNLFHGEIPRGLSVLTGLIDLDLSRNNFSGPIPSFLGDLRLIQLNLSHNILQGSVPTKGIFGNETAISLEGNIDLCGGIPELRLPPCSSTNDSKRTKNSYNLLKVFIPIAVFGSIFIVLCLCVLIRWKTKSRKSLYSSSYDSKFQRLSYGDLLRATSEFSEVNLIGSGRFGVVYKGSLNDGNLIVGVKVLNLQVRGAFKSFMRECKALRGARHRNLLKILSICVGIDFQGNDFTALVYPFKANGSLEKWLHQNITEAEDENIRYLTLMQRLNIAIDIASGVEYLHDGMGSAAIIHGDLKPSNILLDDDTTAHVGDFGLAKVISNISSSFAADNETNSIAIKGTIGYIPPEYGMVGAISTQGDVYSYGILLLEMFTNMRPTSDALNHHENLHKFVATHLSGCTIDIVDPLVMTAEGETMNDITIKDCVVSILRIGVACSNELPQDRMSMAEVVIELQRIRAAFPPQRLS